MPLTCASFPERYASSPTSSGGRTRPAGSHPARARARARSSSASTRRSQPRSRAVRSDRCSALGSRRSRRRLGGRRGEARCDLRNRARGIGTLPVGVVVELRLGGVLELPGPRAPCGGGVVRVQPVLPHDEACDVALERRGEVRRTGRDAHPHAAVGRDGDACGRVAVGKLVTAELTRSTRDTVPARQLVTHMDPAPKASAPEPSPVCTNPLWLPSASLKR